jgi:catechol 1,2-dioxygenase
MANAALTKVSGGSETTSTGGVAAATMSAILGPFYREGAPQYKNGESILKTHEDEDVTAYVHGRVLNLRNEPIIGAEVQ